MGWKTWALVIGFVMLALAIVGLILHSDPRIVGADGLGAVAAVAIIVVANRRGRSAVVATRVLSALTFLIIAILTMTSHAAHWLTALTLAGAFAFTFMSWTAISSRPPLDLAGPRPA
jgi:hypothetical protein